MPDTAAEWIERLGLAPLEFEGGYYRQTWRSDQTIATEHGERARGTAIYYLLSPDTFSAMHRLAHDEVYFFHAGDPVAMLLLEPDGARGRTAWLGNSGERGVEPQVHVRRGVWQGSRLMPGGRYALLGTAMAPGFDFADFELGERSALLQSHPEFADTIVALTRP